MYTAKYNFPYSGAVHLVLVVSYPLRMRTS